MVELYGINIKECQKTNTIDTIIQFTDPVHNQRAMNFKDINNSYRSILGELLARYAICLRSGCLNYKINIKYKSGNKPRLLYPQNLSYNISHSGEWVLCAISDYCVGIDVQLMNKDYLYHYAESLFSDEECKYIMSFNSDQCKIKSFYQIWALKESYVKADGRGLSIPMKSFTVIISKKISVKKNNILMNCKFELLNIDDCYIGAICFKESFINNQIKILNLCDIIKYFKNKSNQSGGNRENFKYIQ